MGYWTTDFLVVQRVIAAKDLRAAKMAPIIGAAFKMCVPFIVILPGLLGLALLTRPAIIPGSGERDALATGGHSYNEVLPLMLARYCGPGLLGLGITALIAGFMSGMAGNVSAFATVWTYDIYRAIVPQGRARDAHYVSMGRWCTILGVLVSIGTAYLVMQFASIMDYVQALFSFFIAPLFGTVLLGMLWKRATPAGGFWGLLAGTLLLDRHVGLGEARSQRAVATSPFAACQGHGREHVPRPVVVADLRRRHRGGQPVDRAQTRDGTGGPGLRLHRIPSEGHLPLWKRPVFWAGVIMAVFIVSTNYFLVRSRDAQTRHAVHLVFHWRPAAGLWNPDSGRRALRTGQSAGTSGGAARTCTPASGGAPCSRFSA